jgi:hypothetical protein
MHVQKELIMAIAIRQPTLVGFVLMFALACNSADRPTAPSVIPTRPPRADPPPPPPVGGPPSSAIAGVYVFVGSLAYPVHGYTTMSRYVVNDDGSFALQYQSIGGYAGTYTYENGRITFRFAADGQWDAIGTFNGDSLEVRYNLLMELSDFENAAYRRMQ